MENNTREKNVELFEALLKTVELERQGMGELLEFIRKSDFYVAPASTRYHLAEEGGLLQHSLDVYFALLAEKENHYWKEALKDVPMGSLLVVSLLHDLCKVNTYSKREDGKGYDFVNPLPIGHGSKSVALILRCGFSLTNDEMIAITHHMGAYGLSDYRELMEAYKQTPLALALCHADMVATHVIERNAPEGRKEEH